MNEKSLENKIKKYLKDNGHYYMKIHGSAVGKAGIPDILCCINGFFVGVEVKNPNGKGILSELQKYNIENIIKSGGYAEAIASYDDFISFVEYIKEEKIHGNKVKKVN